MAKYRNREVRVLEELTGDQVRIEHMEPGTAGTEIVPRTHVSLSKEERKVVEDKRKAQLSTNDFRNIGDEDPYIALSVTEVGVKQDAQPDVKTPDKAFTQETKKVK